MDKYLIEYVGYTFYWRDIGPGPSVRGHITGLESVRRRYHSAYTDLKEVQRVMEERMERNDESDGFYVVSKIVDRQYVPGILRIGMQGNPHWEKVERFKWFRLDHKWPSFHLRQAGHFKYHPCQKRFYQKEKTFAEACKSIAHLMEPWLSKQNETTILGKIRRYDI